MNSNYISRKAKLGKNIILGSNIKIYDNVIIGDNSKVDDFCILGNPSTGIHKGKNLVIGDRANIRSHTIFYEGSSFGPDLNVGHHSLIREGVIAGTNLQIGSYNDIEGYCNIGDWVRFHSQVHIARGAEIGDFIWMFPNTCLTNDPIPPSGLIEGIKICSGATICTGSILLPGTTLGKGSFVTAMSIAKGNIPGGVIISGNKSLIIGSVKNIFHGPTKKRHPWMSHFYDYYPSEAQNRLKILHEEVNELVKNFEQKK